MARRALLPVVLALLALHRPAAQSSAPAVLVSRQLAEAEHVSVGDMVTLAPEAAGTHGQRFRVAGIYEPTADPMRLNASKLEARMHLPDLQAFTANPADPLAAESVDAINIELRDRADAEEFSRDLMARVPGLMAQPVRAVASRTGPFLVLERFHLAIAIVTILASTVFLLALTVMLVDERRETVGVLRLIGLSPSRLLVQVFAEGVLVASVGAAFGILLAIASQGVINRYFQWRYDTALVFVRITPGVMWRSIAIAVPLGVVGSVAASWVLLRRGVLSLARR
jgi:ABC-type lipoprotein release transport system permease subunit